MAFPPSFLDELRARLPLAEVIGRRVRLQRRGREHTGLCPFHNEKSPSFTVNEDKGFFHCFGCGAHGDVIGYVMRSESLAFREAVERLAQEAGLSLPTESPADRARAARAATLTEALEAAAQWFADSLAGPGGRAARDYLARRGLDEEAARRFRLGYAPAGRTRLKEALAARLGEPLLVAAGLLIQPEDGRGAYDRFRDRVIFPILDARGRVIAFGGRTLGDGEPKYLNSPETEVFHKGSVLYGLAWAARAARAADEVVVAEGYMDVIALHRAGIETAVAPLGTALTEGQLALLWRLAREPILCFDGDAAGARAALRAGERALPLLRPDHSLRFALLPPGEDPDSLLARGGAAAMRAVLAAARPLITLLWEHETVGRSFETPERQAGLRHRLGEIAARVGDAAVRAAYQRQFAELADRLFGGARRATGWTGAGRMGAGWAGRGGAGRGPWRPGRAGGNGSGAPRPGGAGEAAEGLGAVRDGRGEMERVILAIALRHGHRFPDLAEELGRFPFSDPALARLRDDLLGQLVQERLDAEEMARHLTALGHQAALRQVLERGISQRFGFAGPDASEEDAWFGWRDMYLEFQLDELAVEIDRATAELAADMTDPKFAHLQRLNEQRDALAVERATLESEQHARRRHDSAGRI